MKFEYVIWIIVYLQSKAMHFFVSSNPYSFTSTVPLPPPSSPVLGTSIAQPKPRTRLPHHAILHRPPYPLVSIDVQVNADLLDGPPAVTDVEPEAHGRGLEVSGRTSGVGGGESRREEHSTNSAALVGGRDEKQVKNLFSREREINSGIFGRA